MLSHKFLFPLNLCFLRKKQPRTVKEILKDEETIENKYLNCQIIYLNINKNLAGDLENISNESFILREGPSFY